MQEYPIQRDALPRPRDFKLNVVYRGDPAEWREIELAFEAIAREMLRRAMNINADEPTNAARQKETAT